VLLTVALVFGLASRGGYRAEVRPSIVGLDTRVIDDRVLVSFVLRGAYDEDMARRVDSGLPTGFDYRVRLVRPRKSWFDSTVSASTLQIMAMYNAITREYLINYKQDGDLIESRVVRDKASLRRALTQVDALSAFDLGTLPSDLRDRRLKIQVRAELGTGTFLFFIPTTITTDWAESRELFEPRG